MQLSCEFATLDISDAIGLKRFNLTKTVRKQPITADMQKAGQVRFRGHRALGDAPLLCWLICCRAAVPGVAGASSAVAARCPSLSPACPSPPPATAAMPNQPAASLRPPPCCCLRCLQATEDRAHKEAKYDEEHPVRLEVEIELWQ